MQFILFVCMCMCVCICAHVCVCVGEDPMVRGMHLAGQRYVEGGAICFNVQGLGASWSKHKKNAELLWEGLEKLGLELLVKDKVGI